MTINLFDDKAWLSLRPLTYTRPVADLRIGILTIAEKWAKSLNADFGFQTQAYLSVKYKAIKTTIFINGSICPNEYLLEAINKLKPAQALYFADLLIAVKLEQSAYNFDLELIKGFEKISINQPFIHIQYR